MDFALRPHTHLLVLSGSRAHGLDRPGSDVDLKGFAVPPARYFHGFLHRFEQVDDAASMAVFSDTLTVDEQRVAAVTKVEGSVYGLRKLARLCADSNPNLLEVLFCRDSEVRLVTDVGRALRDARELFLSQRARHSFAGYAAQQLRRIRGHRAWLLDPPKREPTRADFGLPEQTLVPPDRRQALDAAVRKQLDSWEIDYGEVPPSSVVALRGRMADVLGETLAGGEGRWTSAARTVGVDGDLLEAMLRERRYLAARKHWRQYLTWREHRNPDRAALEARHGYDTKHGAHLVRLLRMGHEILAEGQVRVWRGDHDAEELRAIRAGAWSYDELVDWSEGKEAELDQVVRSGEALVRKKPDLVAIDALVCQLVERALA